MNKKGDFEWETLVKVIIALIVLVFILSLIYLAKDKIFEKIQAFENLLRFGG